MCCLQSAVDLFGSFVIPIITLALDPSPNLFTKGWLKELECKFWKSNFLILASMYSSTFSLVCLTVERWFFIFYTPLIIVKLEILIFDDMLHFVSQVPRTGVPSMAQGSL